MSLQASMELDPALLEPFTRVMFTHIITSLARITRSDDFSVAQVASLYLIDQAGSLRVGDLGGALSLSVSGASRLADGLVQRGLVQREEDASDRRVRLLSLSARGRAFLDRAGAERVRTIIEQAQALPPETAARLAHAVAGMARAQARANKRRR